MGKALNESSGPCLGGPLETTGCIKPCKGLIIQTMSSSLGKGRKKKKIPWDLFNVICKLVLKSPASRNPFTFQYFLQCMTVISYSEFSSCLLIRLFFQHPSHLLRSELEDLQSACRCHPSHSALPPLYFCSLADLRSYGVDDKIIPFRNAEWNIHRFIPCASFQQAGTCRWWLAGLNWMCRWF